MNIISSTIFREKFSINEWTARNVLNQKDFFNRFIKLFEDHSIDMSDLNFHISGLIEEHNYKNEWIMVYRPLNKFKSRNQYMSSVDFYIFKMTEQEIKKYLAFL